MYTKDEFQNKINNKFPNEKLELTIFNGVCKPGTVRCLICNTEYTLKSAGNFLAENKKTVCKKCYGTKAVTNEVCHKVEYVLKNCDLEVITPFHLISEDMKFKCNVCGELFIRKPRVFLKTQKCPYCQNRTKLKPLSVFLNDLENKYGNEYKLLGEYKTAQTPTLFEHTPCGFKWMCRPNDVLRKGPCPRCNSSRGERKIERFLIKNQINYESQKRFTDLKGLSYDFYLKDYNILIEFQGEQHYMPIRHFGGEEKFQYQLKNDKKKREYAKNNQYTLLEIRYDEINKIEDIISAFIAQRLNIQADLTIGFQKEDDIV